MSVIVIGDQGVGKTTLMLELAKYKNGNVQIISPCYEDLQRNFTNNGNVLPTDTIYNTTLQMQVNLFGCEKKFNVSWIDTPGEAWRPNSTWQKQNHSEWRDTLESLQNAQALMIVIAPKRNLLKEELLEITTENLNRKDYRFRSPQQWQNRFQEWMIFLAKYCQRINHILFCINMADLFCDIEQESEYYKNGLTMRRIEWFKHKEYVLENFFEGVTGLIDKFEQNRRLPIQLFVTTYYNRILLELPWMYLGTYLK